MRTSLAGNALGTAIAEAAVDYHQRQQTWKRRTPRFPLAKVGKVLLITVLFAVTGLVVAGQIARAMATSDRSAMKHEREMGRLLGGYLRASVAPQVTLLPLFSDKNPVYAQRMAAMIAALREGDGQVNAFWAVDEGCYDSEEAAGYGACMDRALARHPDTATLVVISAGDVSRTGVSKSMRDFMARGGKLVLIGELSGDSPLIALALHGNLTLIARKTAWLDDLLKARRPAGESLGGEFLVVGG